MRETHDPEVQPILTQIRAQIPELPSIALITGSGLAGLAENVTDAVTIPTSDLDGYPKSTVSGHPGRLIFGRIDDTPVMVVQGRVHYYEGYPMSQVVMPARVAAALGCKAMILTTASGGIGDHLQPGDLVRITDQINLMGTNPLIGQKWGFDQFPDMTQPFNTTLGALLHRVAGELGIELKEGVFGGLTGPSYETPAEIKYLKLIGVDSVSMSTVPETIAAARLKLPVLGITYISNFAAGKTGQPLTHEEVTEMGAQVGEKFSRLLQSLIPVIHHEFE
ncbi:purine-nucleoside phosphorylase [bacterium]|nr:purine-nucleoside phosphorylase [bacterium]